MNTERYFVLFLIVFFVSNTQAQLGFCKGNSGDPIFKETFGEGTTFGKLPFGSKTSYRYKKGKPENGFYNISHSTLGWFDWFNPGDHTENDVNGRMLIVNAASKPGEFFKISVSGLCENTSYEFSSWLINLLPSNYSVCLNKIPVNVRFEIWDSTDSILLKSGNTSSIYSSSRPKWQQYGLVFQTKPGQTSVILKMRNNGTGGCGNDLAIDDIMFRTCGDSVIIEDSLNNSNVFVDERELPYSTTLKATPDYSVFSTHFYQWQSSKDGINWTNIKGENNDGISVKKVNATTYYRTLIAEAAVNLFNSSCNSSSEIYKVSVIKSKTPPRPKIKKRPKVRKKIKTLGIENLTKLLTEFNNAGLEKDVKFLEINIVDRGKLPKTRKKVVIVKDGLKIILNKVWIDGAIGRFIKTGEEIIEQGHVYGGFIVEETVYTKAQYGYNSVTRKYSY